MNSTQPAHRYEKHIAVSNQSSHLTWRHVTQRAKTVQSKSKRSGARGAKHQLKNNNQKSGNTPHLARRHDARAEL
jgi:hypothetical protein